MPPQDITLLITVPRLPVAVAEVTPDPLEDALRLLLRLRVALRDAWVRAGVRVTLRPLLRRLPVVGAIKVGGRGRPPLAQPQRGCSVAQQVCTACCSPHLP